MFFQKSQPKFQFGTELELFTLDKKGFVVNTAPKLINNVKKNFSEVQIQKEVGKNMIEINSEPDLEVPNALDKMIEHLEDILYVSEKENLILYPYGTYPGSFTPELNKDKKYRIKEQILGKSRVLASARCIGLHCHYTLPSSIFDDTKILIRKLVPSKNRHAIVNIYNLFIAMDPALSTFAQSSPFYQGKRLGKDARIIVYRGGSVLKNPQGVYANLPEFGELPNYKLRAEDLLDLVHMRFNKWNTLTKKLKINVRTLIEYGSLLETSWNPVKINAHGTMEYRGMDANNPSVIVAIGIIIKYCAKVVQDENLQIVVSDDAIKNPFTRKGNTIIIPPYKHVNNSLQYHAAYKGLEHESVYNYCKALYDFAKKAIPQSRHSLLLPLSTMLQEKKTVSDEIIKKAKLLGYKKGDSLSNTQAAELSLMVSKDLYKDILTTKKHLKSLK